MKLSSRFTKLLRAKLRSFGRSNKSIFDEIYTTHRWGSNSNSESSSGKGSQIENTKLYEDFIVEYIKNNNIKTIVDVGCGDFQVSKRILSQLNGHNIDYLGTDVSQVVIDRNIAAYENNNIKFRQLDATKENIPKADLITIREVLQHLPNKDVKSVLSRLVDRYENSHILVTNTVANDPIQFNIDIPAGSVSRAGMGSGLWINKSPFNFCTEELCQVPHNNFNTTIVTSRLIGCE